MKIAKKKKKPKLDTKDTIRLTNYLNCALFITAIWEVNQLADKETRREDILEYITAYKIYLQEAADHRQSVGGAVEACKALTGIDAVEIIDEVFGGRLI